MHNDGREKKNQQKKVGNIIGMSSNGSFHFWDNLKRERGRDRERERESNRRWERNSVILKKCSAQKEEILSSNIFFWKNHTSNVLWIIQIVA